MAETIKLVDVTKCDGCRACMVSCKNWNDLPSEIEEFHGSYQSHEKMTANTWNVLTFNEQERKDGGLDWLFRHSSCLHCTEAACEKACPENAISHTEFGSVVVDYDTCVGCGYCVQACSFDAINLATYIDKNGKEFRKAQKCTQCTDRLEEGLQPACATACHTGAIVYGDKDELLSSAEERLSQIKERYPNANIYNPQGIRGTNTVYILADKPTTYGLPENPKVALSQIVWKDYAQPIGKAMLGVTSMAVIGAFITNTLNKKNDSSEGDHGHE
ncbi:4Fe-4S dicluster domain-containing protein [Cytobacillus sp. FJAT-53684]|uniref:4Fe-4S dicluster domain-containing protein n=1 Tax=Cytobacillus mangrovibacter TaxID=3299024 RepID=A0ABW6K0U9_9BACI